MKIINRFKKGRLTLAGIMGFLFLLCTLPVMAQGTGFTDDHANNGLMGWIAVGGRTWSETGGSMLPQNATGKEGFLITEYPCADNGTFEAVITADPWNGQHGGLVFRWTSPSSFYFISVKPGNQWVNSLVFTKNSTDPNNGTELVNNLSVTGSFTLKVEMQGSTFRFYINGSLKATITDTDHAAGRVGYAHSNAWNRYAQFESSTWQDEAGSTPSVVVEPGKIDPANVKLTVYILDEGLSETNIIKPRLYIENTGTVAASNFKCYYYFTVTENKTPVIEDYYTPTADPVLYDLGANGEWVVEFSFPGITLQPGEVTPDRSGMVIGIHFADADYPPMDKTDDFSNPGTNVFTQTNNVPVIITSTGPGTTTTTTTVGGTNPLKQIPWKQLKIVSLYCDNTEDYHSEDDCYMDIKLDGDYFDTISRGMNDGQTWDINRDENYYFRNSATMDLYDEDSGDWILWTDEDDHLGTVTVAATDGRFTGRFDQDDALYIITYEVTTVYFPATATSAADIALTNFQNSTAAGLWPHIAKADLIADMQSKIADPSIPGSPAKTFINQFTTNTCGGAAILYPMIQRSPLRYVVMCRDLYLKGEFHGRVENINTSADVRNRLTPTANGFTMPLADWMCLASLWDDRDKNPDPGGDGSDNDDVEFWLKEIVGCNRVDKETSYLWGEIDALEKGRDVINAGGVAILNIRSELLNSVETTAWEAFIYGLFYYNNHYITLVGDVAITGGHWYAWDSEHIRFRCFTWGNDNVIIDVDEGTFEDYFYGVVYGY